MKATWRIELERAISSYRAEAAQRRKLSKHDPAADALEYAANDLELRIRVLTDPTAERTPEEYAAEKGVSAQTVRNWINAGRLPARKVGRSFRIASSAEVAA